MKEKKTLGFYLVAVSTILAIVSVILYNNALMKTSTTTVLLVIAAVVGAAAVAAALLLGKEIPNLLAAAHAVLVMAALGVSIAPMVNEIGLVYAGLNPQSNLTGYITFAVFAGITWLIAVVAAFIGTNKKNA